MKANPTNRLISMPKISSENKQYYKSKIRSILAQDHQITKRSLQERLKADGLDIDRKYLGSLLNDIYVERTKWIDSMTLSAALSSFQDTMTEVVRRAWEIVNDPMAERNEVLGALCEIRAAHNDVFEKLFDVGVFDRKLGSLELKIRNAPLSEAKKQALRSVFESWGMLPAQEERGSHHGQRNFDRGLFSRQIRQSQLHHFLPRGSNSESVR